MLSVAGCSKLSYFFTLKNILGYLDGYTVSDVVMYWRDKPVVGVEDAKLPQFTINKYETNERKIKLATGLNIFTYLIKQSTVLYIHFFFFRNLSKTIPFI